MPPQSVSRAWLLVAGVVLPFACHDAGETTFDSNADGASGSGDGTGGAMGADSGLDSGAGKSGSLDDGGAGKGAGMHDGGDHGGATSESDAGAGAGGDSEGGAVSVGSGGMNVGEAGSGGMAGAGAGGAEGPEDEETPSCVGLAKTCGPSGNASCCTSPLVTGGTYDRSNDPSYPATVSAFRLDRYEVTVGRFRKFLSAYSQDMIAAGSGRNPNDPNDPGWDPAWNASLPVDDSALRTATACSVTFSESAGPNENMPMNCIDWFEANAFCIWDGGRLPSEAEWNYAAAGGSEQRLYPWGASDPNCTYANFFGAADGTDYCVWEGETGAISEVGATSPKGDGKWGQSELVGNMGEWILDWYATPYAVPCIDCANTEGAPPWCPYDVSWCAEPALYRGIRGGSIAVTSPGLATTYRDYDQTFPTTRNNITGVRCARSAP